MDSLQTSITRGSALIQVNIGEKMTQISLVKPASLSSILWLLVLFFSIMSSNITAQANLTLDDINLEGVWYSDGDWGDYDNDGDLDLLIGGYSMLGATGDGLTKLYRNDTNSVFTEVPTGMDGVANGTIRWCDFDNDNDLDAFLCGQVHSNNDTLKIYINNNGTFTDSGFQTFPKHSSSVSFADYDNDGDYDFLLTGGYTVSDGHTEIWRNDGNFVFTQITTNLPGIQSGQAIWADYDADGDVDVGLTGRQESGIYITKIFKNNGTNTYTSVADTTLMGLRYSRCSWLDYDCDGDLDFIVSGSFVNESPSEFHQYRNDGNDVFTEVLQPAISGERQGDMVWGDINNDGYPDLLLNGLITNDTTVGSVFLYNPTTGLYTASEEIIYLKYARMLLGDYNNDHKLDLSLSGRYAYQDYYNDIYMNTSQLSNSVPYAPTGLNASVSAGEALFAWDYALDNETPDLGLSYNIRIGTTPGGNEIRSAMAVSTTGFRKISQPGNCGTRPFCKITGLPDGRYYWSVQTIDNSFAPSPFAATQILDIGVATDDNYRTPVLGNLMIAPNPFQTSTTLSFDLSAKQVVNAKIYNVKGELVADLHSGLLAKGTHQLHWDTRNLAGNSVAAGIYMLRIGSDQDSRAAKLLLLK